MKLLNVSFEVNSDLEEHNLRVTLEALGAKHMKTLPDTSHVKDDKVYLEMYRKKKANEKALYKYVDSKRDK